MYLCPLEREKKINKQLFLTIFIVVLNKYFLIILFRKIFDTEVL
jgi:hypothetical protein